MDDKEISAMAIGNATEAWDQRFVYANNEGFLPRQRHRYLKVNGCYTPHNVLVGAEAYLARYGELQKT